MLIKRKRHGRNADVERCCPIRMESDICEIRFHSFCYKCKNLNSLRGLCSGGQFLATIELFTVCFYPMIV